MMDDFKLKKYELKVKIENSFMNYDQYQTDITLFLQRFVIFQDTHDFVNTMNDIFKGVKSQLNGEQYQFLYETNQIVQKKTSVNKLPLLSVVHNLDNIFKELMDVLEPYLSPKALAMVHPPEKMDLADFEKLSNKVENDISSEDAKQLKNILSKFAILYPKFIELKNDDNYKDKLEKNKSSFRNTFEKEGVKGVAKKIKEFEPPSEFKGNAESVFELLSLLKAECSTIMLVVDGFKDGHNTKYKLMGATWLDNITNYMYNFNASFEDNPNDYNNKYWIRFKVVQFLKKSVMYDVFSYKNYSFEELSRIRTQMVLTTMDDTYTYLINTYKKDIEDIKNRPLIGTERIAREIDLNTVNSKLKKANKTYNDFKNLKNEFKEDVDLLDFIKKLENFIDNNQIEKGFDFLAGMRSLFKFLDSEVWEKWFKRSYNPNEDTLEVRKRWNIRNQKDKLFRDNLLNSLDESEQKVFKKLNELEIKSDLYQQNIMDWEDFVKTLTPLVIATIIIIVTVMTISYFVAAHAARAATLSEMAAAANIDANIEISVEIISGTGTKEIIAENTIISSAINDSVSSISLGETAVINIPEVSLSQAELMETYASLKAAGDTTLLKAAGAGVTLGGIAEAGIRLNRNIQGMSERSGIDADYQLIDDNDEKDDSTEKDNSTTSWDTIIKKAKAGEYDQTKIKAKKIIPKPKPKEEKQMNNKFPDNDPRNQLVNDIPYADVQNLILDAFSNIREFNESVQNRILKRVIMNILAENPFEDIDSNPIYILIVKRLVALNQLKEELEKEESLNEELISERIMGHISQWDDKAKVNAILTYQEADDENQKEALKQEKIKIIAKINGNKIKRRLRRPENLNPTVDFFTTLPLGNFRELFGELYDSEKYFDCLDSNKLYELFEKRFRILYQKQIGNDKVEEYPFYQNMIILIRVVAEEVVYLNKLGDEYDRWLQTKEGKKPNIPHAHPSDRIYQKYQQEIEKKRDSKEKEEDIKNELYEDVFF